MDSLSIYLLNVDRHAVRTLRETSVLDTYQGATKAFHEDGLYSIKTFGDIGSEMRDERFSFIDTHIPIISPTIALSLFDLKRLYKEIMNGSRYATWDDKEKDFIPALPTDSEARTGYSFFMSRYKELVPAGTDSIIRGDTIALWDKFKDIAVSQYILVQPAGLRDLEVDGDQEKEDEVTPMYRKIIATARLIPQNAKDNDPIYDTMRWQIQNQFNLIWKYFFDFEDGKKGYIRGKWAARTIVNGTRNVISSVDPASPVTGRKDAVRVTDTKVGLLQGLKALLPIAVFCIKSRYLQDVDAGAGKLWLIDPKTLKRKQVSVSSKDYDRLTTDEGIEELIDMFRYSEKRNAPYLHAGHYIALLYRKGSVFKVFKDIDDMPGYLDKADVSGITYAELLYLSGYDRYNDYFMVMTRYPITGDESTYPSTIRLTTTVKVDTLYELEDDWHTRHDIPACDFPKRDVNEFISSLFPTPGRVRPAGGDFDGDMMSGDGVYTNEAMAENKLKMGTVTHWFNSDGSSKVQIDNDVVTRTLNALLGDHA